MDTVNALRFRAAEWKDILELPFVRLAWRVDLENWIKGMPVCEAKFRLDLLAGPLLRKVPISTYKRDTIDGRLISLVASGLAEEQVIANSYWQTLGHGS